MVIQDHERVVACDPPLVLYRQLLLKGFKPHEAANLVAFMEGLPVSSTSNWTIEEIQKLLFIKSLTEKGTIKTGS